MTPWRYRLTVSLVAMLAEAIVAGLVILFILLLANCGEVTVTPDLGASVDVPVSAHQDGSEDGNLPGERSIDQSTETQPSIDASALFCTKRCHDFCDGTNTADTTCIC